jgi:biotin-(acetyl-CoA carboxylase) ligase
VGDTIIEGIAEGLTPEAALLIRTSDGSLTPLTSGEVTRFSAGP